MSIEKSRLKAARNAMKKHGLGGFNTPKRTPGHAKKSHMVMAKEGSKTKLIRFGEQGASTAGEPKAGESGCLGSSYAALHGMSENKWHSFL